MVIYGSMLCPDCVQCVKDLDAAGVEYRFCDFADDLMHLKEFLKIRDTDVFEIIKQEGKIGIPCIVHDDGSVSFSWK